MLKELDHPAIKCMMVKQVLILLDWLALVHVKYKTMILTIVK